MNLFKRFIFQVFELKNKTIVEKRISIFKYTYFNPELKKTLYYLLKLIITANVIKIINCTFIFSTRDFRQHKTFHKIDKIEIIQLFFISRKSFIAS